MGYKLEQIIDGAKDDLREQMFDGSDGDRAIHEIADSSVPVYNHSLLELFSDDPGLAYVEPELGHGLAGDNMIGKAQAIIYEKITEALWEEKTEVEEALREIEDLRGEREDLETDLEEVEGDARLDESERADCRNDIHERMEEIDGEIAELRGED